MATVMTIEGASLGSSRSRPRSRGECKRVRTGRKGSGCTIELCFVGKSRKSRSGWAFQAGTRSCRR